MNIKHILQTVQTMARTRTQCSQACTTNGLSVHTGIQAGISADASGNVDFNSLKDDGKLSPDDLAFNFNISPR